MNILWLFRYTTHRHYNHWFHTDFAKVISEQEGINLKIYGYRMQEQEDMHGLLLKNYNQSILMEDLRKEFNYNIVILDCWNRAYENPSIQKMWLPKDFKNMGVPKIVIEGDFHNIKNPNWYSNLNIDLILHRHFANVKRANISTSINNKWLPCSLDTDIFKPNYDIIRTNRICAVGEMSNSVYKYRIGALNILKKSNLIDKKGLIRENKYIDCLQHYTSHLNGSSLYDLNIAKMFEIMASGSVLLTDKTNDNGLQELFPDNSYCTYNRDYSDLLSNAKKIINEPEYRKYITTNAVKCIREKHTHKIRAKQFIDIIKQEFKL